MVSSFEEIVTRTTNENILRLIRSVCDQSAKSRQINAHTVSVCREETGPQALQVAKLGAMATAAHLALHRQPRLLVCNSPTVSPAIGAGLHAAELQPVGYYTLHQPELATQRTLQ